MRLTKHHGLGNDFLVLLDLDDRHGAVDGEVARALCHRRTGIGADGLIRVTAGTGGADLTMQLWNADGSAAELSGNGLRCLAQAARRAGLARPDADLGVATDAGVRTLHLHQPVDAVTDVVDVDMGAAADGPAPPADPPGAVEPQKTITVGMGNPHLVRLHADRAALDADVAAFAAGTVNVEFVTPTADGLDMRVVERGVGETLACGTGACAAAFAAHGWGLVGARVAVHQPGGTAVVTLRDDGGITLTGPSVFVASIEVPA